MKCLFLHTETGGADARVHALLSVGAVIFDLETSELISQFHALMRPNENLAVTERSWEINQLDLEALKSLPSEAEAYTEFAVWLIASELIGVSIWAHNADTAHGFLQAWEERVQTDASSPRLFAYRPSFHSSEQLLKTGSLRGLYPDTLATSPGPAYNYFGIEPGEYNALNAAIAGAKLVGKLWALFGWAQPSEEHLGFQGSWVCSMCQHVWKMEKSEHGLQATYYPLDGYIFHMPCPKCHHEVYRAANR